MKENFTFLQDHIAAEHAKSFLSTYCILSVSLSPYIDCNAALESTFLKMLKLKNKNINFVPAWIAKLTEVTGNTFRAMYGPKTDPNHF